MADNVAVRPSTALDAVDVRTDEVSGSHYQVIKTAHGADGTATLTDDVAGSRFPVGGGQLGATDETAPASDTAPAGINGRLQRIAQRITSFLTSFDSLTGALTETAPASDTASSGLNGRLQRIAQRITSLITTHDSLNGALTETAPASDTASSGHNGRLQRIAQRITSLITTFDSLTGALTETAPASDTASSGLNGRLQRIAQRITSLITTFDSLTGALTETAPASDTASSGLNGRLQRIAQRLTSLIALIPAALTTNGSAFKTGASEATLTATIVIATSTTLQATGSDLAGLRNWGIIVPSTFDGTQIQFQMSDTLGGTYVGVYDINGNRVIMTVAASRFYDVPGELMAVRFLKIETVTAQATTDTIFTIVGRS